MRFTRYVVFLDLCIYVCVI